MIQELETRLPLWGFKYNQPQSPRVWIYCHAPESEASPLETLQAVFDKVEISIINETLFAFPLDSSKLK